jgi:cytochrome P450
VEPEVQQKIRDEFRAIIDPEVRRGNAPFTAEMLDKLEYLTAVSSEVLRMFPTVPITPRVAQEDVVIGGVMMPKGTLLFMSAWALQRMEDVWGPEAGSFCPDRWLNGEHAASGGASAPHAFMSFISGPRSCIGQHLARYELRCMILSVLDRFDVARPPNTAPMGMTGIISNQPDRDLRLTFRKLE